MQVHIKKGVYGSYPIEDQTFEHTDNILHQDRHKRTYLRLLNRHNDRLPKKILKILVDEDNFYEVDESKVVDIKPKKAQEKENNEKIRQDIKDSFDVMTRMVRGCARQQVRGLVISGAPGVGKSHEVQQVLAEEGYEQCLFEQNNESDDAVVLDAAPEDQKYYVMIKGRVTPLGLYTTLHTHKDKIIVFDDCDSVLSDTTSLNLLKAALDSYEKRYICWNSRAVGGSIPRKFEFTGTVIFISNIHFDMIKEGSKLRSHIDAIMSRCHYLDLSMKSNREKIIRLQQVIEDSDLFHNYDLTAKEKKEIINFITDNQDLFREISLRTALKVADIRVIESDNWQGMALKSCLGGKSLSSIE